MVIEYSCEVSLSLDRCCAELDKIGARYKVLQECRLGFKAVPVRKVKEVLTRYGFVRDITVSWPTDSQLEALQSRLGRLAVAKFIIVRPPSTMEDEGRHFLEGTAQRYTEALAVRRRLKKECKGYYSFDIYKKVPD